MSHGIHKYSKECECKFCKDQTKREWEDSIEYAVLEELKEIKSREVRALIKVLDNKKRWWGV